MSLIYWDTMLFVYWLEENPRFSNRVGEILRQMEERDDALCTSCFTVAEILVAPYKQGDEDTAQKLRTLFQPPFVKILPFTTETAVRYAKIRATLNVFPADAIQLACAAEAGVDLFLTNDGGVAAKRVPGIQFIAGLDVSLF